MFGMAARYSTVYPSNFVNDFLQSAPTIPTCFTPDNYTIGQINYVNTAVTIYTPLQIHLLSSHACYCHKYII